MENFVEAPTPIRPSKGLLAVPAHSAVGPRPKSLPQRFSMHHARRPSTSSPLALSQTQAETPRMPVNSHSGAAFEGRTEQAAESTFYKRLRIDVSEPVGNMSISPANRDVCLAARKGLFIIDLENPYETPRFIPQGGTWEVADVQWNPHPARSNLICSTSSQKLLIWDLNMPGQNAIMRRLHAHYRAITDINWHSFTPDVLSSCGIDSWIWTWDLRTKKRPVFGNLPFGDGVLALPQRGAFHLEMFAWDAASDNSAVTRGARLATSFEGHRDVVKEYVWRGAGGLDPSFDDREFQLVTWSKDNTLRLWPVDQQLTQECGHVPGSPIQALMPRRGAVNETYRVVPNTAPPTPATPSLTAPFTHRSILANVKTTQLGHLPLRRNERKKKNPGFMTRGARVNGMDPVTWMSSVKVEREIDSGQNSMFGSRATSVERANQAVGLARRRSDRSLSRSMDFEAEGEGDAEDLADEITSVSKALGNKVKFVKTDISKKRMCTVTLNGPWGETQSVFIRITFQFPPEYPRSLSRSAIPTIDLEKNPEIGLKDRAYILRNLRKIRLHTRPCLEACLRFLLGMPDMYGRMYGGGVDTDSDSEGEQRQSRSGIVSHLSNHADNVPMPRRCQGVFGPNGELVCFFPAAPVIIRDGRTPSPSTTSRTGTGTGTGTGSAGRLRPFAPSAIVSHALRGLSQLAVDKPTISTSHPKARDAAGILRFSDHLFARTSMSRPRHSDSVNSWNSTNKPAQVAPTHTFVVIKNLAPLIPTDRILAEKYAILGKNPAALCRTNATVARDHSRHDHERIWKMLATVFQQVVPLHHGLQGDAKNAALRMFDEKKQVSIEDAYKSVQWGYNPLAKQIVKQIYADVAEQKDVQMLAMISIVLLSADIAAGPKVRPLRKDLNSATPVRISIDYFSLRKRVPRLTPTDSPTWPKSASVANISPASQSLSSSGNSKNSWQSYINNRFRLGSMPDIQAAVNAASKGDSPGSSRAGSAGMRLLNVVASIPVPGGGRLTGQTSQPPPANTNDLARRRQSMMSTATLDSSASGRAPSDLSSGRLSVHFNHTPHRRSSMIARAPVTKPVYSSKAVAVGYRPTEHDEEDLPTMVPFIEPDMVAQHHKHIVAYAELLAQWGLHYKSTELLDRLFAMGYNDGQWREGHGWRDDKGGRGKWRDDGSERWDNQGDSKRRRTDHHDARDDRAHTHGGDSNQGWDHGGYYEEYNGEEYPRDDGAYDRGKRDRGRMVPSELSAHVIFLGLDQEFNEADLTAFLATHHAFCFVYLFLLGVSKSFGFAEFTSPEAARVFVEPNFPFIYVPPKASQLAQGYSEDAGRRVKIDYSQSAQPRGPAGNRMHNDGTRDIGNTQAPVVLLRGVDFQATVGEIAEAVKESTGPKCDGLKGARKVMLIRDKQTKASLGFAFVEYISNTAASRLLAATMSPELHPSGFRIGSRAIAASFAHPSSFQPLDNRPPDEYSLVCTQAVGGSETGWCSYWDQTAFAEAQEFQVDQETIAALTASAAPEVEKKKEKKKEKTKNSAQKLAESAGLTVISDLGDASAPSTVPQLSKPLSLSLNKAGEGDKKIVIGLQKPGNPGVFGGDDPPVDEDTGPDPSKPKVTIWKANPLMQGKKARGLSMLTLCELSGKKQSEPPAAAVVTQAPSNLDTITSKPVEPSAPAAEELPYGDPSAMTCLLCSRQFKSVEMLKRHSNESELHKTNLGKPELVESAKAKIEAARQVQASTNAGEKPKYRDRAAERRVALRQPDHPMPEPGQGDKKRKWAEGPPPPAPAPPPPVQPGKDDNNVGNKLLKKMGWSEGVGLGAGGEGRVNPIETAIYEQGVGIGASKAKEVTNFQGYREMAKDSARERYNATQ
ncbi:unnamed protein product [Rhizoctonia solani]|uniref:Uncharacterized protein n=1 Tax=Rhizoctonia solani TaxID=456999 RepID=A0A8H2XWE5_9AGAM|nr:unnamed protein product [Rhizoctonia solani]